MDSSMKIYIAFRGKEPTWVNDTLVSLGTWSYWVHTEIVVKTPDQCRAFSAYQIDPPSFIERPNGNTFFDRKRWLFVPIPIDGTKSAAIYQVLHDMTGANLRYATGYECIIPESIVDRMQPDIDYSKPPSQWPTTGIFCSQAAFLFLKQLHHRGCLKCDFTDFMSRNSYHCSPAELYDILVGSLGQQPIRGRVLFSSL